MLLASRFTGGWLGHTCVANNVHSTVRHTTRRLYDENSHRQTTCFWVGEVQLLL